jgi:hypothetical protein
VKVANSKAPYVIEVLSLLEAGLRKRYKGVVRFYHTAEHVAHLKKYSLLNSN